MVRVKKEKSSVFKSNIGANIKLNISLKNSFLKITVVNSLYSVSHRKVIILICILCNVLCLILNILNAKLITANFVIIFFYVCRLCGTVKEECLMIIKGLGIQMTTKYTVGVKTIFIPKEQVQNIFVNEVIYRNKVMYVLNLLTKDTHRRDKLIPLFFETLPRLACLKVIYNNIKAI